MKQLLHRYTYKEIKEQLKFTTYCLVISISGFVLYTSSTAFKQSVYIIWINFFSCSWDTASFTGYIFPKMAGDWASIFIMFIICLH